MMKMNLILYYRYLRLMKKAGHKINWMNIYQNQIDYENHLSSYGSGNFIVTYKSVQLDKFIKISYMYTIFSYIF